MPNFNFNIFQRNAKKNVQKSFKDLSHEWKHDFSLGNLIPCLCIPTLPGDDFEIESQFFFKFDPMYYPIIHRVGLEVDYWWVRNANMWKQYDITDGSWEQWIMMQGEWAHPTVNVEMRYYDVGAVLQDSIYGYIGVPYVMYEDGVRTTVISGLNAFPAEAYLQIYNQGYRHPQLEEVRGLNRGLFAGDNTTYLTESYAYGRGITSSVRLSVLPSKWQKDYFTSLLPEPQAGDAIQIPMTIDPLDPSKGPTRWLKSDGTADTAGVLTTEADGDTKRNETLYLDTQTNAATVRQLSIATVLQTLKEQLMRFGQRYKDWIDASHDEDVDPLDLGIPIMFGNWRGQVNVSEVLSQATSENANASNDVGEYVGNAGLFENGSKVSFKCRDYGILMAIFSLTPNSGYGQGIPRWLRYSDPLDYPMDIFASVGDQEILNEEIFYNNVTAELDTNQRTFGYGVRFQEAYTIPNNYGSNLAWNAGLSAHLGKYYNPDEVKGAVYDTWIELDKYFIDASDAIRGGTRVGDVFKHLNLQNGMTTQNAVTGYILHKIGALRPLPAFSTPSLGL